MTLADVAAHLRLRPSTVRSLAHRGELPYYRLGEKLMRFRSEDIDEYTSKRLIRSKGRGRTLGVLT